MMMFQLLIMYSGADPGFQVRGGGGGGGGGALKKIKSSSARKEVSTRTCVFIQRVAELYHKLQSVVFVVW